MQSIQTSIHFKSIQKKGKKDLFSKLFKRKKGKQFHNIFFNELLKKNDKFSTLKSEGKNSERFLVEQKKEKLSFLKKKNQQPEEITASFKELPAEEFFKHHKNQFYDKKQGKTFLFQKNLSSLKEDNRYIQPDLKSVYQLKEILSDKNIEKEKKNIFFNPEYKEKITSRENSSILNEDLNKQNEVSKEKNTTFSISSIKADINTDLQKSVKTNLHNDKESINLFKENLKKNKIFQKDKNNLSSGAKKEVKHVSYEKNPNKSSHISINTDIKKNLENESKTIFSGYIFSTKEPLKRNKITENYISVKDGNREAYYFKKIMVIPQENISNKNPSIEIKRLNREEKIDNRNLSLDIKPAKKLFKKKEFYIKNFKNHSFKIIKEKDIYKDFKTEKDKNLKEEISYKPQYLHENREIFFKLKQKWEKETETVGIQKIDKSKDADNLSMIQNTDLSNSKNNFDKTEYTEFLHKNSPQNEPQKTESFNKIFTLNLSFNDTNIIAKLRKNSLDISILLRNSNLYNLHNLKTEITAILKEYGFQDVNLKIEAKGKKIYYSNNYEKREKREINVKV